MERRGLLAKRPTDGKSTSKREDLSSASARGKQSASRTFRTMEERTFEILYKATWAFACDPHFRLGDANLWRTGISSPIGSLDTFLGLLQLPSALSKPRVRFLATLRRLGEWRRDHRILLRSPRQIGQAARYRRLCGRRSRAATAGLNAEDWVRACFLRTTRHRLPMKGTMDSWRFI